MLIRESINIATNRESLLVFEDSLKKRQVGSNVFPHPQVVVLYDHTGRRGPTSPTIAMVSGPAEAVKDYLAQKLQQEGPAHPANNTTSIQEAHTSPDGSILVVRTYRSNYYGD